MVRLKKKNLGRIDRLNSIKIALIEMTYQELYSETIVETLIDNRMIYPEEANPMMAYMAG